MARYIEYCEAYSEQFAFRYRTDEPPQYFFMPIDKEAADKENKDSVSGRIWKFDTFTGRVWYVLNCEKFNKYEVHPDEHWREPVNRTEFFTIQLKAEPMPYSNFYYIKQRQQK